MPLHGIKLKPPVTDPAAVARANLVQHARKWKAGAKKERGEDEHARRMYGEGSKAKVEGSSEAKHPARQHIKRIGSR